jgi:hypothetical protein
MNDIDKRRKPWLDDPWGDFPCHPVEILMKYGSLKEFLFHTPGESSCSLTLETVAY